MIKLTVLYGHPTHLPLVAAMKGFEKVEYTKFISAPDGTKPSHYRMAEIWFERAEALQATMGSTEGRATGADLANFATGGATLLIGAVEK